MESSRGILVTGSSDETIKYAYFVLVSEEIFLSFLHGYNNGSTARFCFHLIYTC